MYADSYNLLFLCLTFLSLELSICVFVLFVIDDEKLKHMCYWETSNKTKYTQLKISYNSDISC